jgi:hypothetical protein
MRHYLHELLQPLRVQWHERGTPNVHIFALPACCGIALEAKRAFRMNGFREQVFVVGGIRHPCISKNMAKKLGGVPVTISEKLATSMRSLVKPTAYDVFDIAQ